MKRNLSDYLVALAVIICSLVLLGALTVALSGYRLQKPSRTLQIDYEDVAGIKVHSEVRYAGAPAGRVIAMSHLSAAQRVAAPNKKDAVRVSIELLQRPAAALRHRGQSRLRHHALAQVRRAFGRNARKNDFA